MKKLSLPIGVFFATLLAGIVLLLLPGKTSAPIADPHANIIVVNTPVRETAVSSPLIVSGKARGTWYFEASFPVVLTNASGTVLAQEPAQAQGDWMTTEFVPFALSLTYPPQPSGSKGLLVLKKDNPSGDPSKDDSVEIPITFK